MYIYIYIYMYIYKYIYIYTHIYIYAINVCVQIYMNKKNTKFIKITNISLLFQMVLYSFQKMHCSSI